MWKSGSIVAFLFLIFCATYRCDDSSNDNDPADSEPEADIDTETDDDSSKDTIDVTPAKAEKVQYQPPTNPKGAHFSETFDDVVQFNKRWIKSTAKKDGADSSIAKYDGKWEVEETSDSQLIGDKSLVLKSKAHHHAISVALNKAYEFTDRPFVIQYEVRFKNGLECGGAYVKLLSSQAAKNLMTFHDKSPYTIMFGPDKCGNDHKLHFIFRHRNPISGEFEEKHAKKPTESLDSYFTDKNTHLYRLVVKPDNTFEVSVDSVLINEGSLLKDVEPPVNPPEEIDDPDDKKPSDWDDKPKIKDVDAVKPDDWDEDAPQQIEDKDAVKPDGWLDDEPELIPNPDAQKPTDWDTDMDGEWEAPKINNPKCSEAPGCGEWKRPMIANPAYKGKWTAPMIDNPDYQGIWKPKRIPNPNFFKDDLPFQMTPIHALGLELWSMTDEIIFDNFLITDSMDVADDWTRQTFHIKSKQEKATAAASAQSVVGAIMDATNERPWLWAVIIVVVVLPIVLIIAYCCLSGSKSSDDEADRKKTDEVTPDDEEPPALGEAGDAGAEVSEDVPPQSRSDLNAEEGDNVPDVGGEDSEKEGSEEDANAPSNESASESPGRAAARKRKTRKE